MELCLDPRYITKAFSCLSKILYVPGHYIGIYAGFWLAWYGQLNDNGPDDTGIGFCNYAIPCTA